MTKARILADYVAGGTTAAEFDYMDGVGDFYDANRNLRIASNTLKRNLQTYLSEYRMINDSVDILDAKIVNLGVNFAAIATNNVHPSSLISA